MNLLTHFLGIWPEIFLFIGIMILLLYGLFITNNILNSSSIAIFILFLTGFLILNQSIQIPSLILNEHFIMDSLGQFGKILILIGTISHFIFSNHYFLKEQIKKSEYSLLILLSILGLLLFISAYDLISLYLTLELQALALYVLASYKRNSEYSTEAGLKYFILGAFSSGLFLFGSSLIYGFSGLTQFNDLIAFVTIGEIPIGFQIGIIFLLIGLLFKIAAVPFHFWIPDVYEGSPTSVTAYFAIVPKVSIIIVFIRLLDFFFESFTFNVTSLFSVLAFLSLIVGSLGALFQTRIKRLLAYSAIGHIGYLLLGFAAHSTESMVAILVYLSIYIITLIIIFAIILSLYSNEMNIKYITELSGLAQLNPWLGFIFSFMLFSLAGIPPLAGFFGKLNLLMSTIHQSLYFITIIAVLISVMSTFYYIRIIEIIYFDSMNENLKIIWTFQNKSIIMILGLIHLLYFFYSDGVLNWMTNLF